MKSKIEALENKAKIEFAQLKSQSTAKSKQSLEDYDVVEPSDDIQYGDYNDVSIDKKVEKKQKMSVVLIS